MPDKYTRITFSLEKSPFTVEMEGITFHFSSKLRIMKFCSRLGPFTEEMQERLFKRYCIRVQCPLYAAIVLYNMVETTGFLITTEKGEKITWPKIVLSGNLENESK